MSKKTETSRSVVSSTKKTTAIYRKLENLILNLVKTTRNIPNVPMVNKVVERLTNELLDCSSVVEYAYVTQSYDERFEYLSEMKVHLTLIRTCIKLLFEFSSFDKSRFMTPEHHAEYLTLLDNIETQRERWAESTLRTITSQNDQPSLNTVLTQADFIQSKGIGGSMDFGVPENSQFMPLDTERIINDIDRSDGTS